MLKPLDDNLLEKGMFSGFQSKLYLFTTPRKCPFTVMDAKINQVIKFSVSRMKQTAVMSSVDRKHQVGIVLAESI